MIKKENLSPDGKYRISVTNELTVEELEANPQIKEIHVWDDRDNRDDIQEHIDPAQSIEPNVNYTRDEYIKIKNQIQRIKNVVCKVVGDNPDVNEENKEKNIFMAVYLMLGLMKYDHETVRLEDETDEDQEKSIKIRNLYGGLMEDYTVCLGYAQILKNILSEFGIDSKVVLAIPQKLTYDKDTRNIEAEHPHAWNIVKLDGMEYQCDLTGDAEKISKSYRQPNYPNLSNCLTKGYEFNVYHNNYDVKVLEEGMDYGEQRELMQYYFDVFKKIYDPTIVEELDDEIDDPIVSELMDESTNPIYVYNSDNIEDENNIDEEEIKDVYKQVMGLLDKFKSKPVIFGEQDIGKAIVNTPTIKKNEAQRQVTRDEKEIEQGNIIE